MLKKETKWLFPTPITEYDLFEYLTPEISTSLQSLGKSANSLVEGIRADSNPANLPECEELYKIFQKCVDEYSTEVGLMKSYIFESWMNILTKGGAVSVHRHYNSIISAAFYPYVEPDSADLVFVNPAEGFRMMDAQAGDNKLTGVYTSNVTSVKPETGKLVLFPSWVQHYVPTNKSALRVTISFNTRF